LQLESVAEKASFKDGFGPCKILRDTAGATGP